MPVVEPPVQSVPHRLASKPGHRIIRQPSDAPMPIASVLSVLLKYLCLDFFDLDFFTVSSILVLWTEEVSGRCPETREGRLPLDPRPLIG